MINPFNWWNMRIFPSKTTLLAAAALLCLPAAAISAVPVKGSDESVKITTIELQSQLAGFGPGVEVSRISQYLSSIHGLELLQTQAFKDISHEVRLEGGLTVYGASPIEDFTKIVESYGKRGAPVQFHYHPVEKRLVVDRRDLKKGDAAIIVHRDFASFRTQTSLVEPVGYRKESTAEIEVVAQAPVIKKPISAASALPATSASVHGAPSQAVLSEAVMPPAPAKKQVHFDISAKERLSVALDRFLAKEGFSLRWEAKGLDMESTTDSTLQAESIAELVNQILKGTGLVAEIYTPSKLVLIKQHPVSNLK